MRKLLLVLIAVLLPLQWSFAAVVAHCPAQASARAGDHDAHGLAAGGHGMHGMHGLPASLHGHDAHQGQHSSPAQAPFDAGADPSPEAGGASQAGAQGQDAGCCHAGLSLLPGLIRVPHAVPAVLDALAPVIPPLSHASGGPFRPPSPRLA